MGWFSTRHLRCFPPYPHPCCCSNVSRHPTYISSISNSSSSAVSTSSCPTYANWTRVNSRFLVLVLLLCQLVISTTMGVPVGEITHVNHRVLAAEHRQRGGDSDHASLSVTRLQRLQSVCSGNFLQIVDKSTNARARADSPFAVIRVESATNGTVRLRSQSSRVFLCFNKMGAVVIRYKAGKGDRMCLFREHHMTDSHVTQYQSAEHATWWLGFSTSGGALSGSQWQRNPRKWTRCLRFAKTAVASSSSSISSSGSVVTDGGDKPSLHEAATSNTHYRVADAWTTDSQSPLAHKSADLHRPIESPRTFVDDKLAEMLETDNVAVKTRTSDDKRSSLETERTVNVAKDATSVITKHHDKHTARRTAKGRGDKKTNKLRAAKQQQATTGADTVPQPLHHILT